MRISPLLPNGKWKNEHAGGESIEFARLLGRHVDCRTGSAAGVPTWRLSPQCWDGEGLLPCAEVQRSKALPQPLQEPMSLRPGAGKAQQRVPTSELPSVLLRGHFPCPWKEPPGWFLWPKRKNIISMLDIHRMQPKDQFWQMLWEIQEKFKGEDLLPS